MDCRLVTFNVFGDARGKLVSLEGMKNVPFSIKRVYYMYSTVLGQERGHHAHRNLEQILICLAGSVVCVLDDGKERKEFLLNSPNEGIYIGNYMWRELKNLSEDCVIMVLASDYYDEKDYIRNYQDFLNVICG